MAEQSHHYVPQVYLKGFFDPKQVARRVNVLWRYRPGGRPEAKGTRKIAEQTNFYDLPEVDEADNDIEQMFSEIERTIAWDLKKLRAGKIALRQQQKAHLSGYFGLQYTRTPWFRELANKSVIRLQLAVLKETLDQPGEVEKLLHEMKLEQGKDFTDVASMKRFMGQVIHGEVPLAQGNKAWNAKVMLQHADDTGKLLYDTRWSLLEAPEGTAFITSDNPVSLIDPAVLKRGPQGFKPSKDFQFVVPVSPQFMLIGECDSRPDRRTMIRPDDVHGANALHMQRAGEVYASFESKELQAEFDKIVKERPPSIRELPEDYLKAALERARRKGDPNGDIESADHGEATER